MKDIPEDQKWRTIISNFYIDWNWAVRYIQDHPEDSLRFKLLLINLLCHFASQTSNTLDDELVDEVARHLGIPV